MSIAMFNANAVTEIALLNRGHGQETSMEWMEMIKVQTASNETYKACEDYLTRLEAEQDPSGPAEIRRYHNAAVECCYAIVLKWTLYHPEVQGSSLAQHLIHDLRHFGMVNHSVWITPNSAKQ